MECKTGCTKHLSPNIDCETLIVESGQTWWHKIGHKGKRADSRSALSDWCERGDSNPHGFTRQILSLVRLPIPPLSHAHNYTKWREFFRSIQQNGLLRSIHAAASIKQSRKTQPHSAETLAEVAPALPIGSQGYCTAFNP
jgi:hypothetical protein